ncbi:MAG TPA: hypothetical protein VGJ21_08885 [Terracidiphilus sp.]|jgi:hypothetical protein
MSRIKRTNRASERQRRNKGPELISQAADNELQEKASLLAGGLSKAMIERGDVAAASLLVDLAEVARYNGNPGAMERAFSLIDQWERVPQVAALDTNPQIAGGQPQLRLTDGAGEATAEDEEGAGGDVAMNQVVQGGSAAGDGPGSATPGSAPPEILDGEYEMVDQPASAEQAPT